MKTFFKTIIYLHLVLLGSCRSQINENDIKKISVNVNLSTVTNLTDIFTIEKCVFLETDSISLIRHIFSLKIKTNSIYLLTGKKLLLFNDSGTFIRQINRIGNGPQEMLYPSDFSINRNSNEVGIMDNMKSEIVYYSNQGEYIRRKKLPLKFITNFTQDSSQNIFVISQNTPQGLDRYDLYILDSSFKVKKKEFPYKKGKEWLNVIDYNCFTRYNNNYYMKLPFKNSVYELSGNGIKPYLKLDFEDNTIPEDFYDKFNQSNYMDFPKTIAANKYVELNSFQEFTDAYYLTYNYNSEQYVHLISKKTSRSMIYKANRFDFLSCIVPRFTHESYVIGVIEPAELKESLQMTLPSIRIQRKDEYDYWVNIAKNLKTSDNPVLVYMKIKQF